MPKPNILIVGCGAVGLSQGFHLSTGASITYLVRPGRKPTFSPPKRLYDYKTDALHDFSDYRVIESVSEVSGEQFLFVFDTLDGHTAQSPGGTATLSAVGKILQEPQNAEAFVVYDAIGANIESHYSSTLGISKDRLVLGLSMLAHQPTGQISIPPTASREKVERADMLYSCLGKDGGLAVVNKHPKLTRKIEEVYNVCGRLRIQRLPAVVGDLSLLGMVQLAALSLADWVTYQQLSQKRDIWTLLLKAQTETLSLPRYGWTGWLLSWVLGGWATEKMLEMLAKGAEPLQCHEFNRFHHGGKVVLQDVDVLEELVEEGDKVKVQMPALREICRRLREKVGPS